MNRYDMDFGYNTDHCLTPSGHFRFLAINESPRGKTNNVVSEQVQHKSGCTVKEDR